LAELAPGGRRYQDLHDALDGISHKVLTETLRRAERDGLIARHVDGERIETATLYELTDLGRSLDAPLAAMTELGTTGTGFAEQAVDDFRITSPQTFT
jgi:DNA-binding HxlR family transcriptional regulator